MVANDLIKQINGKIKEIIEFRNKYFELLKEANNENKC